MIQDKIKKAEHYALAGTFTLALRLVVGWTYFSAFWRRMVIEDKMDPEGMGYIGEKFNHFLPNALGIKPMIEHLVLNPELLWWAMLIFTLIEAVVGLFIMFGLFTRLMGLGVFGLATGILLGSGWIGTTCLDEWQIGTLGMATGFTLFLTGGGRYAMDNLLLKTSFATKFKWLPFVSSGPLPLKTKTVNRISLLGAGVILFATLYTNQHFHSGIWGDLHNKSVRPIVEIHDANLNSNKLTFMVYRVEGADVYGSFLIGIDLLNSKGELVLTKKGDDLAQLDSSQIDNIHVAKVKPGKHSLIIPLGSKAILTFTDSVLKELDRGVYTLVLTDISGATWKQEIELF